MSLGALLGDVMDGNFSHAFQRVKDWWASAMPELTAFVEMAATDEGKILEGLISTAAQDVLTGGLTTASFVAAGKDVLAKLVAQNISTFNLQAVMAMLNIKVSAAAPPVVLPSVAAPVDAAPVAAS